MPTVIIVFKAFQQILFKPLLDLAAEYNSQFTKTAATKIPTELKNDSVTPLMYALRTGMVQYKAGVFTGKFSRAISAGLRHIGARTGTYRIKDIEVPSGIKSEAMTYEVNAKSIHETIVRKLNEIQENLNPTIEDFELRAEPAITAIQEGFEKSARSLAIMPTLTEESLKILAEEYTENLKLYIKKFTEESINDLRTQTEDNAIAGYRFDRLAKIIEDKYKVSATKAEFLARTETSIFMSKFREREFSEAGITRYIWRTSGDQRVRDVHKHLNGKIFFYSQPPIADIATGTRANPGGIWNCRCIDEPILDPVAVGT